MANRCNLSNEALAQAVQISINIEFKLTFLFQQRTHLDPLYGVYSIVFENLNTIISLGTKEYSIEDRRRILALLEELNEALISIQHPPIIIEF